MPRRDAAARTTAFPTPIGFGRCLESGIRLVGRWSGGTRRAAQRHPSRTSGQKAITVASSLRSTQGPLQRQSKPPEPALSNDIDAGYAVEGLTQVYILHSGQRTPHQGYAAFYVVANPAEPFRQPVPSGSDHYQTQPRKRHRPAGRRRCIPKAGTKQHRPAISRPVPPYKRGGW